MHAAEIGVAVSLDELGTQHLDCADVVVVVELGVPGLGVAVAVGVEEDDQGGEVVVVVDDVLEVDVAFFAFVLGHEERSRWVVDGVDGVLPALVG